MSGILEWFLENENGWQPIRQLDYFGWLQATVYVYEDNYEMQGFIGMERNSFLFLGIKTVRFFLCAVERYSIIKSVFLHMCKSYDKEIGKPYESLGRKATGHVKW